MVVFLDEEAYELFGGASEVFADKALYVLLGIFLLRYYSYVLVGLSVGFVGNEPLLL